MYIYIHYTFSWRGVKPFAFQNKDIDMDNICNKLKYETLPIKYTAGLFLACIYVKSLQNLTIWKNSNILYQIVKAMIHHWFRFETSPSSFSLGSSRQSYISYLNLEI